MKYKEDGHEQRREYKVNGTAKMLTDNRGRVVWPGSGAVSNELLPFGKDLDFDPAQPDPIEASYNLTFTGKEIDRALGLHDFGARWYDAGAGQFLSPDPVGGNVESPLSWNRYLYCRNDPINYIDPDGNTVRVDRAITGNTLIQMIEDIEQIIPYNSIMVLKQFLKGDCDYYLEAPGVGELNAIDVKHMLAVALVTFSGGDHEASGIIAGHANEIIQWLSHSSSEYDVEDLPSNKLGAEFGKNLKISVKLSKQLRAFLKKIGVNMDDPASLERFKEAVRAYYASHPEDQNKDSSSSDWFERHGLKDASGGIMFKKEARPKGWGGR